MSSDQVRPDGAVKIDLYRYQNTCRSHSQIRRLEQRDKVCQRRLPHRCITGSGSTRTRVGAASPIEKEARYATVFSRPTILHLISCRLLYDEFRLPKHHRRPQLVPMNEYDPIGVMILSLP